MKTCSKCKDEKSLEDFVTRSANKDGKGSWCKICMALYRREKGYDKYAYGNNKGRGTVYQKERRKTKEGLEYERDFRKKYLKSPRGIIGKLLAAARRRAKLKGFDMLLDRDWVQEHLAPMKCEASGAPLTLELNPDMQHSSFRPSIDRIDSSKGYIKSNCRIVCVLYNKAKSDGTDDDVIIMAKHLMEIICQ